ncbi:hypothetical protein F383_26774 [Gossypium arboreum]|uniref:Uncharacterized protein n=1 Tax=Gossypium arboreum TaxID=29729 RepID=A0A0B0P434_GOSAR|nr:hypothetical protein F383_26774 [Gossypium arboreum]
MYTTLRIKGKYMCTSDDICYKYEKICYMCK